MILPTGTRLGRYEIRSQLGAGGRGEVYLAENTRLRRKVAIYTRSTSDRDALCLNIACRCSFNLLPRMIG